jgi:hypothetical protein
MGYWRAARHPRLTGRRQLFEIKAGAPGHA